MNTDTIRELLDQAAKGKPLGVHPDTLLYPLPAPFSDYLLRVETVERGTKRPLPPFRQRLQSTTLLTPVSYHVRGNYGQPVLDSGNGFQLVMKKGEESLNGLWRKALSAHNLMGNEDDAIDHAWMDLVSYVNNMPEAHLRRLLEEAKELTDAGISIDPMPGNVMIRPEGLGIIDIGNGPDTGNNLRLLKRYLIPKDPGYSIPAYNAVAASLHAKLDAINETVGLPATQSEAQMMMELRGPVFKAPCEITEIGRLSLADMPHALLLKLGEIEAHLGMPMKR